MSNIDKDTLLEYNRKANEAKSPEEIITLGKEIGIEISEEKAKNSFAQIQKFKELSDDELDNVNGGMRPIANSSAAPCPIGMPSSNVDGIMHCSRGCSPCAHQNVRDEYGQYDIWIAFQ